MKRKPQPQGPSLYLSPTNSPNAGGVLDRAWTGSPDVRACIASASAAESAAWSGT